MLTSTDSQQIEEWLEKNKNNRLYCQRTKCWIKKDVCQKRQDAAKNGLAWGGSFSNILVDSCFGCPQGNIPNSNFKLRLRILKKLKGEKDFITKTKLASMVWGFAHVHVFEAVEKMVEENLIEVKIERGKQLVRYKHKKFDN